ncbi:uncharacterized protein A4U43_C08F23960 [Asparagus officinalis]|nr:uncharacterized protein A4U43_C08F23960 [Asparagus officinalis]
MPRGSSRIKEESPTVLVQEPQIGSSEDEEEKVDYGHDNTDDYLTELDDAGDIGDISSSLYMPVGEAMATSFLASGCFESVINYEGVSGVLASVLAIETTKAPALAPILGWKSGATKS